MSQQTSHQVSEQVQTTGMASWEGGASNSFKGLMFIMQPCSNGAYFNFTSSSVYKIYH